MRCDLMIFCDCTQRAHAASPATLTRRDPIMIVWSAWLTRMPPRFRVPAVEAGMSLEGEGAEYGGELKWFWFDLT